MKANRNASGNIDYSFLASNPPKILAAPLDFGSRAKQAEMARKAELSFLDAMNAAQAAMDAPKAKRASSGLRSGNKRAAIKRAWLSADNWNLKPGAMLAKLNAMGIESTESSIASIRSDMRACMLAIGEDQFAEAFKPMLAGKGLRSNDPLAFLNRKLWENPRLDRNAAIEMMAGMGARSDFIGGSLAASKESIAILAEMGAFDKAEDRQAA